MQYPHRFKVGETVQFTPSPVIASAQRGTYKIVRLMPPVGDDNQYRIQSVSDGHERVVREGEIG